MIFTLVLGIIPKLVTNRVYVKQASLVKTRRSNRPH